MASYSKHDVQYLRDSEVTKEKHGSLEYVAQQGENGSVPTYQEASGAPVEVRSPLGYQVQWFTIIFLNIGQMVGTGVFSTREHIRSHALVPNLTHSCQYSQSYRLCGSLDGVLGDWVHHWMLWTRNLPGTGFVFSLEIGLGGRVLGAGIPSSEMVLPHSLCYPVGYSVFQLQ